MAYTSFPASLLALAALLLAALGLIAVQVRRGRRTRHLLEDSRAELRKLAASLEPQVEHRTQEMRLANAELQAAKARLGVLSARLIAAQEQERGRIARELHDATAQALAAIRICVADIGHGNPGLAPRLDECVGVVDGAIAHLRQLALSLRPTMLDDLGLADAVEWQLQQHAGAAGWKSRLDADDIGEAITADVQTACFRIAQEALDNAARHARAAQVEIALRLRPDRLELSVQDDGTGFDLEHYRLPQQQFEHFGVFMMEQRAALVGGRVWIETAPGRGTRVSAEFPLAQAAPVGP